MAGVQAESRSICSPKVEPRLPLGRLRSTSQSVTMSPSEQKKKIFGEAALFFLFLFFFFFWTFCQMSTFTSFSLVSLTLALHAPNLAYAFSMSPPLDPCLHIDQPRCTYVAPPPKLTFFVFIPSFSRLRRPRRHCLC